MSQQPEFDHFEPVDRVVNNDPREQLRSARADYQSPDAQQIGEQKIYPSPRKRRRWLLPLAVITAALALLAGQHYVLEGLGHVFFSQGRPYSDNQSKSSQSNSPPGLTDVLPEQAFSVQGTPSLTIKDPDGMVQIHRGDNNRVVIHPTLRCAQVCTRKNVHLKAETNGINNPGITVQADFPDHDSLDLDITVPATSNIEATNEAGDLTLNGVSGRMDLTADAGMLTFENGVIQEKSAFKDKAGSITFDGALAPNGDYNFKDQAGSIDMTLPADSAFTLDVNSDAGQINNEFGSDTIGTNPTSRIHASTTAGEIHIHKK